LYISSLAYTLYTAPSKTASPCVVEPVFISFLIIDILPVGSLSVLSADANTTAVF